MLDRLNEDFRFYQQALALRAQRQEVLSSNIANADTPNYKARDIDFKAAMQATIEGTMRLPDTSLKLTSARHIPGGLPNSSQNHRVNELARWNPVIPATAPTRRLGSLM